MTLKPNSLLGSFSENLVKKLKSFGWDGSRNEASARIVAEVEQYGFQLNDVAAEAIYAFGGYSFHIPNGGVSWIEFELREAMHTFCAEDIESLEFALGSEPACPVAAGAGYILLLTPSGKAALLHEQWFSLDVCNSFAELLDAILSNNFTGCHNYGDIQSHRPE